MLSKRCLQVILLLLTLMISSLAQSYLKISGRVIDEMGRGLPNITLSITSVTNVATQMVGTDEEGRFTAQGLSAGMYRLRIERSPGYITDGVESWEIAADQALTISLVKGGVIGGQVRDAEGKPVAGIPVTVLCIKNDKSKVNQTVRVTRETDDRGEYRIYGLWPGTYLIFAGGRRSSNLSTLYRGQGPVYAPGGVSRTLAREIVLVAGQEINDANINLLPAQIYVIKGQIRRTTPQSRLTLFLLDLETKAELDRRGIQQDQFQVEVGVGQYELVAMEEDAGTQKINHSQPVRVTIETDDVSDITLRIVPSASVAGKIESSGRAICGKRIGENVKLQFIHQAEAETEHIAEILGNDFHLNNLMPGLYRWRILSGEIMASGAIELLPKAGLKDLKLKLAKDSGGIIVEKAPPGILYCVILGKTPDEILWWDYAKVDGKSRVEFTGLPPGEYLLLTENAPPAKSRLTNLVKNRNRKVSVEACHAVTVDFEKQ